MKHYTSFQRKNVNGNFLNKVFQRGFAWKMQVGFTSIACTQEGLKYNKQNLFQKIKL